MEADGDGRARAEFARNITIGGFGIVLADILRSVYADYDGRFAGGLLAAFTQDLLFRLGPVLQVSAGDSSIADVDFFGAAADRLMPVGNNGRPRVGGVGSSVHESIPPEAAARSYLQ
jgi:hypothetical protein